MSAGTVTSTGNLADAVLKRLARERRTERRWAKATLIAGVTILAFAVLVALLHPLFGLPDPNALNFQPLLGPSAAHPLGTDDVGRDIFSRTLAAVGLDLRVTVEVTGLSLLVGVTVGAVAGYFGGVVGSVAMRLADVVLAFPFMVLVITIIALVGSGLTGIYIAVPAVGWAIYARFTRAEMLRIRERDFVDAGKTLGYSHSRILMRHALPNVVRPALVFFSMDAVLNIVTIASLSYLGLGVQPPTPELGSIINEGYQYLLEGAWWISTLPGLVLVVIGVGFALTGDGLADYFGEEIAWAR